MKIDPAKALACIAFLWAGAATAQAQPPLKIGYVDVQMVIAESDAGKAARAHLEAEFGKRYRDLQDVDARLRAAADTLEKDAPSLSEAERTRRSREIGDQSRDLDRKRRAFEEDLEKRKAQENALINERMDRAIKQVFDAEKFDLILQENVAYANQRTDITRKVVEIINQQK